MSALSEDFVIVPFSDDYLDEAYEIEYRSFADPWSRSSLKLMYAADYADCFAAVLREDPSRIAAYGAMYCLEGEAEIVNLATSPDFRRRGCAGAILDLLIGKAESKGAKYVLLEVRESNAGAIALYGSRGFVPYGIRKNYYRLPTENAIVMKLDLPQNSEN